MGTEPSTIGSRGLCKPRTLPAVRADVWKLLVVVSALLGTEQLAAHVAAGSTAFLYELLAWEDALGLHLPR